MHRTKWALVAVATVAWLIAGCSSTSPSPGGQASSSTPSSAAPGSATTAAVDVTAFLPAGSYSVEIPAGMEAAPGRWVLEIAAGGLMWTNPENGARFSPGTVVEVTSSTLVLGPDPACPDQVGAPTAGTYRWQRNAGQLSFTLVSDSCAGRRDTLIAAPWTLVP